MPLQKLRKTTRLRICELLNELRAVLPRAQDERPAQPLDLFQLEERVLLSASPAAAVAAAVDTAMLDAEAGTVEPGTAGPTGAPSTESIAASLLDQMLSTQTDATSTDSGSVDDVVATPADASQAVPSELVFLDTSVENYQQLLENLRSLDEGSRQIEVVLLSGQRDGVDQITEALAARTDIDAISIVSQGTDRAVKLGSTWLTADNLAGYAGEIGSWGNALNSEADLLFYGCDLASSEDGLTLLGAVQLLTGADTVASIDNTGTALLGGNGELDGELGSIETTQRESAQPSGESTADQLSTNWQSDPPSLVGIEPAGVSLTGSELSIRHEVVFVDTSVEDYQQLLDDLWSNDDPTREFEVVLLQNSRDGIEQISEALAERSDLDAVHFVTHGTDRAVKLGATWLSLDNLGGYAGEIAGWGNSLDSGGDLLFYGCDLAGSESGRTLLEGVQTLTGADVAGSTNDTGASTLGGDWDLEFQIGDLESQIAFSQTVQAEWHGLLNTFTVTNTNDSGAGSLRQAILDANALAGHDTIQFAIAGTGVHTINVGSSLTITDAVTIDATTDDSFAANSNRPAIILDGNNSFTGDGFVLTSTADGTTIRGFVIRDFSGDGIEIQAGSDGNTIVGNYIGQLNANGNDAGTGEVNTNQGIRILGANNTIGGTSAADRNVISGNNSGVYITGAGATGNVVAGNYIGTNAAGTTSISNGGSGIWIDNNANDNTVGGATAAHGNVISGNTNSGVRIDDADGTTIQHNRIGTNADGTAAIGNGQQGVRLANAGNTTIGGSGTGNLISGNVQDAIFVTGAASTNLVIQGNLIGPDVTGTSGIGGGGASAIRIHTGVTGALIGGTNTGEGNMIAFNSNRGIGLASGAGTGNSILGNTIHSNGSGSLDIDLGENGVTLNDTGDGDSGPNDLQNFPVLTSAHSTPDGTRVIGSLNSNPNTNYRIEFFNNIMGEQNSSGYGGGRTLLGAIEVTTDGSGNASFDATVAGWLNAGDRVTATATVVWGVDSYGSTSEFSQQVTATSTGVLVVTTNADNTGGDTSSIANLQANRGGDNHISLREAILAANNTANSGGVPDLIAFDILTWSTATISVNGTSGPNPNGTGLDFIVDPVVIDATTQRGYTSTPLITLDGAAATGTSGALILRTNDSTIRGFSVINFNDEGLEIDGSPGFGDNNLIEYNWVGINTSGNAAGNADDGILVTENADNNIVRFNVVGSNGGDGIVIRNTDSDNNWVYGNIVGLAADGTTVRANNGHGVAVYNAGTNNIIGSNGDGSNDELERNIISGNGTNGIWVSSSSGTVIRGNYIGTNSAGTLIRGNSWYGIEIDNSSSVVIDGNLISGNTQGGISLWNTGTTLATITSNYIGTNAAGTAALGNTNDGIKIGGGANNNTIGGDRTLGEGNVISGNTGTNSDAIEIGGSGTNNNKIYGNLIGTNATGTAAIGNARYGVVVYNGAQGTEIGGTGTGQGNIISGNTSYGIIVDGNNGTTTTGTVIVSNLIGLNLAGTGAIANGAGGISLFGGARATTIGGTTAAHRNVISGNNGAGIRISDSGTQTITVAGNFIGTDASGMLNLGNALDGILVTNGAHSNTIGGEVAGAGNLIAFNDHNGVNVVNGATNAIVRNSIHSNVLLGINLGTAGVTANDSGDGDTGANSLQNFPVLTSAVTTGTQITISGTLNSTASTSFRIEFYSNATGDGTGHGEGQMLIGVTDVTTDGLGNASFSPTFTATISAGSAISATVSRLDTGDAPIETSEFAQNVVASLVNDAPVLDDTKSPALTAQNEDSGAPSGAVGTLVSSLVDFASPAGQVDNVTDPDSGALLGIAITAVDSTFGSWWYSTDNGATWNSFGAVSESDARLLAADVSTRIYFQPNANWNGTLTNAITFRAWDQTSGTNGGTANLTSTVADQFSTIAYSNNDGSSNWTSDWIETDDNGSASTGNIRVESGKLHLNNQDGGGFESIQRSFSTDGASSATLTFTYDGYAFSGNDFFAFDISNNGGSTWVRLEEVQFINDPGTNFSGSRGFNLQDHLALTDNMVLRFGITAGFGGPGQDVNFDNVQISLAGGATGGTTAFSTASDIASLVVNPVADTPSVTNATTNEDTQTSSGLVLSRNVADGAEVTHFKITGITSGTLYQNDGVTQITNGSFITFAEGNAGLKFTPDADFNGTGNFTIQGSTSNSDPGLGGSTTVANVTVNDAPVESTIEGAALAYTENDGPVAITSTLAITDVDDTNIESAVVQITGNYAGAEDVLAFTNQNGITGNLVGGTLTLTGSATLAQYEAAIRSITYENTSDNPSALTRTISFTVNDGDANSNTQTRDIAITPVNDAPTITNGYTHNLTGTNEDTTSSGTLASAILSGASWADVDNGADSGLAITATTGNGTWQYSTDGVTWNGFGAVSSTNALLITSTCNRSRSGAITYAAAAVIAGDGGSREGAG
ncbi:MAG: DUF4347 domain-containing protein [Planctomycetota bacterium]|nr:DUF4347 domain-containing protein [Planctomycetota bacterium]